MIHPQTDRPSSVPHNRTKKSWLRMQRGKLQVPEHRETKELYRGIIPWFPYVLALAVFLFAFSTMISWSYYGERCWVYLFGDGSSIIYKFLFLLFAFLGSVITATNILDFSDLMILGMAFPNILGLLILSGVVKNDLNNYLKKLSF